jgi:hypothetical protein
MKHDECHFVISSVLAGDGSAFGRKRPGFDSPMRHVAFSRVHLSLAPSGGPNAIRLKNKRLDQG